MANVQPPPEFVFLWSPDTAHGVLLSRDYHQLLERIQSARAGADTWGGFMHMLGAAAEYVRPFTECDEVVPNEDDRLSEIWSHVFVLNDAEFPLTQCAQESFELYGESFPEYEEALTIKTEYGMPLRLYPSSRYLDIKLHLNTLGYALTEQRSVSPMHISSY